MKIGLVFTVDVENNGISVHNERNHLSWEAISNIPKVKSVFDSYEIKPTWFIRADNQLREVYGTSAYLLIEYRKLWNSLKNSGDEIGWHPHLYHWNEQMSEYTVDNDDNRRIQKLNEIYSELQTEGINYTSVRIGEAFHSNGMMKMLGVLGLKIDSTAIPGRERQDKARAFSWRITPNEPYYPSSKDYRIPDSQDHLPILEVPMTTILTKASYDKVSLRRYINLAFHYPILKAGFDAHLDSIRKQGKEFFLVTTIFHLDEVSSNGHKHPLYSFSLIELQKNLEYMLNTIDAHGLQYSFLRMKDVLDYFPP